MLGEFPRSLPEDTLLSANEKLGQHFLVDHDALELLGRQVELGASVIEIGSGPGNLTRYIAQRAGRVVGFEIDKRFMEEINLLMELYPNVEVIFEDVLRADFQALIRSDKTEHEWQIIANLPYHISEPFLQKIVGLPLSSVVMTVGDQQAALMQISNPFDDRFTRTSLVAQTFFTVTQLATLPKTAFCPEPRTDSAVIQLLPRSSWEFSSAYLYIIRDLFNNQRVPVGNVIKTALTHQEWVANTARSHEERHRHGRRLVRQQLKQDLLGYQYAKQGDRDSYNTKTSKRNCLALDAPDEILRKPFHVLNNSELRRLMQAIATVVEPY